VNEARYGYSTGADIMESRERAHCDLYRTVLYNKLCSETLYALVNSVCKRIDENIQRSSSKALAAKQAKLAKTLFECTPAFSLSHACIVTDKLQQIPFWVREVQRADMQPLVYGRIYL
jgi:hypothetical protein